MQGKTKLVRVLLAGMAGVTAGCGELPCEPVDPLEVNLAGEVYWLRPHHIANFDSERIEMRLQQVGPTGFYNASYCIRGEVEVVPVGRLSLDRLTSLPDEFSVLKSAWQVSVAKTPRYPSSLNEADFQIDPATGMRRVDEVRAFFLEGDRLGAWDLPVQAMCSKHTNPEVIGDASCTVSTPLDREKVLSLKVELSRSPVAQWPELLASADHLFRSMKATR